MADEAFDKVDLPERDYYQAMICKRQNDPESAMKLFQDFLDTKPKISWWGTNYKAMRKDSYRQMMDIQMGPVREIQKKAQSEFPKKQ
jgi:hypothetical protein